MRPEVREAFPIGRHEVGNGQPLFVIAEVGLNHGGSVEKALALVDAAATAGASAVKLQTLFAHDLVAASCPAPAHVESASLRDFFGTFELDETAHERIVCRARHHGLAVMATPFSLHAVDLLERVGIDAYKIASGDLTWDGLVQRAASTGKPVVMSTGMGTLAEARHAVTVASESGASRVAVLHCVSAYPTPLGSENLRALGTLASALRVPIGLSDHGSDTFAAPLAVALGASLYERHLVLAHGDGSVDDAVSSTPDELAGAIRAADRASKAMGTGEIVCLPAEAVNMTSSRRALYAVRSLPAGHIVRVEDVIALRPAVGWPAGRLADLVGSQLRHSIRAGEAFQEAS
jgi:N,N'-diacetyllegionaminate synthase